MGHSFVDFEDRLNHVISRLRAILGDTTQSPKFIETHHGIGYRLAVPVELIQPAVKPSPSEPESPTEARLNPARRRSFRVAAAAGLAAVAVLLIGIWAPSGDSGDVPAAAAARLSVPAFVNLTGRDERQVAADALTETVINVLGRSGAFEISSAETDAPTSDAQFRLIGSILSQPAGQGVRLTVRLTSTDSARLVWAGEFAQDDETIDMFQTRVGAGILAAVQRELLPPESERLAAARPLSAEAERLILTGRAALDAGRVEFAIGQFERAVDEDPESAVAHADLARAYLYQGWYTATESSDVMPLARIAALKAIALDDALAEPRVVLANITAFYDWNWAEAEQLYREALIRNANYAPAYLDFAGYLLVNGRNAEAVAMIRKANEIDGLGPATNGNSAILYHYLREWPAAQRHFQTAIGIQPGNILWRVNLACAHIFEGDLDAGADVIHELREDWPASPVPVIIDAYHAAISRGPGASDAALSEIPFDRLPPMSELMSASIFVATNKLDRAIDMLEKAAERRMIALPFTLVHPAHAPLHEHPRYLALIERMGLTGPAG